MIRYGELKDDILGKTCRQCLNKKYHLHLEPKDCIYHVYMYPCERCGQMSNIVTGIRRRSWWKLFLGGRRNARKKAG